MFLQEFEIILDGLSLVDVSDENRRLPQYVLIVELPEPHGKTYSFFLQVFILTNIAQNVISGWNRSSILKRVQLSLMRKGAISELLFSH